MNDPFVIEQTKALAARPDVMSSATTDGRIKALYRVVLARLPALAEVQAATRFLAAVDPGRADPGRSQLTRWEQLAQVLLMTNELMFVD